MKRRPRSQVTEKCQSKQQGDATTHLSEWPRSRHGQPHGPARTWSSENSRLLLLGTHSSAATSEDSRAASSKSKRAARVGSNHRAPCPLPRAAEHRVRANTCAGAFTAALCLVATIRKPRGCPSVAGRVAQPWLVRTTDPFQSFRVAERDEGTSRARYRAEAGKPERRCGSGSATSWGRWRRRGDRDRPGSLGVWATRGVNRDSAEDAEGSASALCDAGSDGHMSPYVSPTPQDVQHESDPDVTVGSG